MQTSLPGSRREKGPCSLPFLRRAAMILGLGDMASGSKKRDRKRKKNHSKAGNVQVYIRELQKDGS